MDTKVNEILDNIKNITNEFLAKFDLDGDFDEEFGYYRYEELVTYTVVVTNRFDILFNEFVTKNFPDVTAPIFLWSLLHEVGHAQTDNEIEDEIYDYCINRKLELDANNDDDVMAYFYLPDEFTATKWAYEYMRDNVSEVSELWDRLRVEIEKLHLTIG